MIKQKKRVRQALHSVFLGKTVQSLWDLLFIIPQKDALVWYNFYNYGGVLLGGADMLHFVINWVSGGAGWDFDLHCSVFFFKIFVRL